MPVEMNEAVAVLPGIQCFFDLLVQRYDDLKYPPQVYNALLEEFANPAHVGAEEIERALRWKYARPQPRNLPAGHRQTIDRLARQWPNLLLVNGNGEMMIANLFDPDEPAQDFVSRAFLVHLVVPNQVDIIDKFNHRAVRWFLGTVRDNFPIGHLPAIYDDIALVRSFMNQILNVWGAEAPARNTLDRFLMMFGRHVAPSY
jgi:hypothetical protein